jgi:hypothetical protein
LFRVWILHCEPWEPQHTSDVPLKAIALEPAETDCFSAVEARDYVVGFNASPERPQALWAIQVPVRMRLDRDMAPGALIRPDAEQPTLGPRRPRNCTR